MRLHPAAADPGAHRAHHGDAGSDDEHGDGRHEERDHVERELALARLVGADADLVFLADDPGDGVEREILVDGGGDERVGREVAVAE